MSDNRALLRDLVASNRLDLTLGPLFEQPPPPPPVEIRWNRVRGMMLGLAIGDALGNTTESQLPEARRRQHGEIRNYLPNRHAQDRAVGLPSDDSQLAFWTLEHLIERGGLDPERLAAVFASPQRRIFGIGSAVRQFVGGMRARQPWWQAAARSAGNGALMRIAPITIPHLGTPSPAFWTDAALCAAITHNDRGSIGACVAFAGMLGELLARHRAPEPDWWTERYVELARDVEDASEYQPRGGPLQGSFRGPVWRLVEQEVPPRVARGESVRDAGKVWYSGAYLLETVPSVLFILARHGDDPEEAIVRAVNDTKDNDTIAAIVGAAVGALHGEEAFPRRWLNGLLGRTADADDGRVCELLDCARARFGPGESGQPAPGIMVEPGVGTAARVLGGAQHVRQADESSTGAGPATDPHGEAGVLDRAQGCLLGQLAGDALGSLVEFKTPEAIHRLYPDGVRELADGGTWNTLAGQPTDDSELALMLARTLVEHGRYDAEAARRAYVRWLESEPFDCGSTILQGLTGRPNTRSQANGALMRISPLGIFGTHRDTAQVREWACQDADITHPHAVCRQANALFATAVAFAIRSGCGAREVHAEIQRTADDIGVEAALRDAVVEAAASPPDEYVRQQGWVLIAFRNALYQLLHAPNLETGIVDTVLRGGDTDTNAAVCGALLGAVHGRSAVPQQWTRTLLACRPEAGRPGVRHPRPETMWPVDALDLAGRLLDPR